MAKLLVLTGGDGPNEVSIVGETLRIGREQLNQLRLDDPTVSRFHAEIVRRGYCYSIEDRNSTNGTLLNGEPLAGPMPLGNRDVIAIGNQLLTFLLEPLDCPEQLHPQDLDASATQRLQAG